MSTLEIAIQYLGGEKGGAIVNRRAKPAQGGVEAEIGLFRITDADFCRSRSDAWTSYLGTMDRAAWKDTDEDAAVGRAIAVPDFGATEQRAQTFSNIVVAATGFVEG